jgi:hypothetical protein
MRTMAISTRRSSARGGARAARADDEEVERFREQLNAILEAVGKVAELDLSTSSRRRIPSISSTPGPTTSRGRRFGRGGAANAPTRRRLFRSPRVRR